MELIETIDDVRLLSLDTPHNVPFSPIKTSYSGITAIKVDDESDNQVTVYYETADTYVYSEPSRTFTNKISFFEGVNSPVGNSYPLEHFNVPPSSSSGGYLVIKSEKLNFRYDLFSVGLSVNAGYLRKTLCSYAEIVGGEMSTKFNKSIRVSQILSTHAGYEIQVNSSALTGVSPISNEDTIWLFQVKPTLKRIKKVQVGSHFNRALTKIHVQSLLPGHQYAVGYYCANRLGACAAKQHFILK